MSVIEMNDKVSERDKERVATTERIVAEAGLDAKIIWHDVEGATSADAKASLGVQMSDIAKSLLFIAKDGSPHMVVILGDRRVDTKKLKEFVGKKVRIAKPEEVLEHTGFQVGGVSPIGTTDIPIYLDKSLDEKEYVHSSAGCSHATLYIKTKDLIDYTKGNIVDVAE